MASRRRKSATRDVEAPLPRSYEAQLATLVKATPERDSWLHEVKFDGYRIGCRIEGDQVTLVSRRGHEWTAAFPAVVQAARRLSVRQALIDGEVAVVLPDGRTSFQALQNAFRAESPKGLTYFVFDLPAERVRSAPAAGSAGTKDLPIFAAAHGVAARPFTLGPPGVGGRSDFL